MAKVKTINDFRNLSAMGQLTELYNYVLEYLNQGGFEVNRFNAECAIDKFEKDVCDVSYLRNEVLSDLEV